MLPNQKISIRTGLLNFSRMGITLEAVMTDPESGRLLAVAWIDMVHIEIATGRPARHEADLMNFFERISLELPMSHDTEKERVAGIKRDLAEVQSRSAS